MLDPKQDRSQDDEGQAERKPEVEPERLKDLAPEEQDDVRGGQTTPAIRCECGTA